MIFGSFGPEYADERNPSALQRMQRSYYEAVTMAQSLWVEADYNFRLYSGDQTLWNDLGYWGNVPPVRRKSFSFNRVRRIVNITSGFQRRNRKSLVAVPIENADNLTADQYTKLLMWHDQKDGILETFSDAFHNTLISGITLLQPWVDYREDPISGDIKLKMHAYNSFLMDPYFRKKDLSDCNYIWLRQYVTKRQAASLLPDKEDEIIGLPTTKNTTSQDGRFQFMPENFSYNISSLLTYDEYYYRTERKQKMLLDRETGESLEWTHNDEDALRLFLQTYPQVTLIEQDVPTVNLTISVQGKVMYDGPNPLNIDNMPFVGMFAYFNPDLPYYPYRIQGMLNDLRDAQFLYNRRKVIELDYLESVATSGFLYKENALVNPNDVFTAGQGKGIALKATAQMTDVQQIQPPQVPPTTLEISKILAEEIIQISGTNEELLGSATDDKAGILSMLRQGAGLTTLQILFDQADHSLKQLGNLYLHLIQNNYTPGKVQKILNGEQPSPQFYQKAFGKYSCTVEEGALTTTQRQMQLLQMLQLREVGVPIPNTAILEAATITNKQRLMESMQQAEQQQQQAMQQQNQLAMAEIQAQIDAIQSKAAADKGLAVERESRVQENQALAVERQAKADRDEQQSLLNLVKALKELDDIDIGQIEKLVRIAQVLNTPQQPVTQEEMRPVNYQAAPQQFNPNVGMYDQQGNINSQYLEQNESPNA